MQEANLIGLQFEFDVGSSNDGRSQAAELRTLQGKSLQTPTVPDIVGL